MGIAPHLTCSTLRGRRLLNVTGLDALTVVDRLREALVVILQGSGRPEGM